VGTAGAGILRMDLQGEEKYAASEKRFCPHATTTSRDNLVFVPFIY
jgi:hypothetical protein